ncbi:LacI family DNA-binding transcriptional regulator [Alloacidobacterium dinghuense]|uniref:LacI family DNA-binding transcriptional regulator n=1 Tax=Alloacidobacterium dinghuense TaxID=2763107 RepID=A0A7G8BM05_9BACT|nr:LacI family DNA-binding transcriptional regulator [Alloacidobacterium dinghuense]QNI33575.1 LacI family DNA-binding transcriptional regulator [Alloacidobacterium dinghuense]
MRKAISLKEIARLAHVSHPTVSRALKNSPLVSQSTKDLIHKIAAQHGYQPNRNARSLVTQRSNSIGCVVTDIADPFISEVISAVEQVAAQHDYSIILTIAGGDPEREMRAVRSLVERAIDGVLVIASTAGGASSPYFSEREIPIVLINNHHPGNFVHSIGVANFEGARLITEHLLELGHIRIGYIGNQFGGESDKDRVRGYRAAFRRARAAYSSEFVIHTESSLIGGYRGMQHLLELPTRPTAVFCYDDITALGAYRAIHTAGLRVSKDISVAGFDDLFFSSHLQPSLTTIRQPMREMGERAMRLLLELVAPSQNGKGPKKSQIVIPGELMIRESTSAPS